jgi:hypothetical protein
MTIEILDRAAVILMAVAALSGLVAGLGLVIAPARALDMLGRDRSTLEVAWFWERFFYRHHRVFGLAIGLAAAYTLTILALIDGTAASRALGLGGGALVISAQIVRALLLIGSFLALPFAAIVFLRPSLLKPLERRANTPVAVGGMIAVRSVARPRLLGALVVAAALYVLAGLALVAFS